MTTQRSEKDDRKASVSTNSELSEAELEEATGGSPSTGSGAGKVRFNEFSITKTTDGSSPTFF